MNRVQAKAMAILEEIHRDGYTFDEAELLGETLKQATGTARWNAMNARIGPAPFEFEAQGPGLGVDYDLEFEQVRRRGLGRPRESVEAVGRTELRRPPALGPEVVRC